MRIVVGEHRFALTLFPGIVYDLLHSDSTDDQSVQLTLQREHVIGMPFSLSNQYLSRCFSISLQKSNDTSHKSLDDDSVKLLLRTVDMLRQVTEHRFYNLKFHDNINSIKGRKYTSKEGSSKNPSEWYTETSPKSPEWHGRPYGIVLQISAKDIVRAFLLVKDFYSALYYTEFLADNHLGSSSCVFEKFETIAVSPTGIDGFGIGQHMSRNTILLNSRELDENKNDVAILVHDMLSRCYRGLNEFELISGLEDAVTNLQFQRQEASMDFPCEPTSLMRGENCMQGMMKLDRYINTSVEQAMLFLEGLGQIGMFNARGWCLNGIDGMELYESANVHARKNLKEMQAEQAWRKLQLSLDNNCHSDTFQYFEDGYHSLLFKSMISLIDGDYDAFETSLGRARDALIRDSYAALHGPFSHEANEYMLKVSTLNEMEDLKSALNGLIPAQTWIEKYELKRIAHDRTLFRDLEMRLSTKEIFSKILHRKFSSHGEDVFSQMTASVMLQICELSREHNRPNIAIAAVSRLKFFQSNDNIIRSESSNRRKFLQLRFEESKNLYCSGDRTSAIRICKETIRNLKTLAREAVEAESLLVDAQVQCVSWLMKHPIDSSSSVLENLLVPLVELAKNIHERQQTRESSTRMADSSFLFGEFTANLFDNLENRMKSEEWKKMLIAAEGRRKEYVDNEGIAKQLMNKLKKGIKLSKEERHQISSISNLKKEVDYDTQERLELDTSLSQYLMQSIEAFGVALSSCSQSAQVIKHVFRFVSLWFKNAHGKHAANVNDILDKMLPKIPRSA